MRPRTATIQVSWLDEQKLWQVEIGDPKKSIPTIIVREGFLVDALRTATLTWIETEKLFD